MDLASSLLAAAGQDPPLYLLLLFPVLWCCVIGAISLVGGWYSLARRFQFDRSTFRPVDSDGEQRFLFGSMSLGAGYFPANYSGCVVIRVGEEGIGLKVWPMFRVLHPPIFIRWSDIENCQSEKYFLILPRTAVYLKDDEIKICFYKAAGKAVLQSWSKHTKSSELSG